MHDARIPLQSVLIGVELLESESFCTQAALTDAQRGETLAAMRAGCTQMKTIMDDLLSYENLATGAARMLATRVLPAAEVETVTSSLRSAARERGVGFSTVCTAAPALAQCGVNADGERLRRAISNVVSNAVRVSTSHESGARVCSACASEGAVCGLASSQCTPLVPLHTCYMNSAVFAPRQRCAHMREHDGSEEARRRREA